MKIIKGLILSIIVLLLFVSIILSQVYIEINSTLLSSRFFNKTFDKANMSEVMKNIVVAKISGFNPTGNYTKDGQPRSNEDNPISGITNMLVQSLDVNWMQNQLESISKGIYSYMVTDTDNLPNIDIKPLKDIFLNVVIGQLMERNEVKKDMTELDKILTVLDNKYKSNIAATGLNESITGKIMKESVVKKSKIEEKTIKEVLKIYENLIAKQQEPIASKQIMTEMLKTNMKYDNIKDSFDMSLFIEKAFNEQNNPIEAVRNMISSYNHIILRTLILLILIFILLIVFITNFKPVSIMRMIGGSMIAGGFVTIAVSILMMFLNITSNISAFSTSASANAPFQETMQLKGWVEIIETGCINILLLQGIILFVIGIGLIVGSFFLAKALRNKDKNVISNKEKHTLPIVIKGVLTAFLLLAVPLTLLWTAKDISAQFARFESTIESQSNQETNNFAKAFSETSGFELNEMMK